MEGKKDGNGQTYFDVGYVRITCKEETWQGCPGLNIRAYKEKGVHLGAEVPIRGQEDALDLLAVILEALRTVLSRE